MPSGCLSLGGRSSGWDGGAASPALPARMRREAGAGLLGGLAAVHAIQSRPALGLMRHRAANAGGMSQPEHAAEGRSMGPGGRPKRKAALRSTARLSMLASAAEAQDRFVRRSGSRRLELPALRFYRQPAPATCVGRAQRGPSEEFSPEESEREPDAQPSAMLHDPSTLPVQRGVIPVPRMVHPGYFARMPPQYFGEVRLFTRGAAEGLGAGPSSKARGSHWRVLAKSPPPCPARARAASRGPRCGLSLVGHGVGEGGSEWGRRLGPLAAADMRSERAGVMRRSVLLRADGTPTAAASDGTRCVPAPCPPLQRSGR